MILELEFVQNKAKLNWGATDQRYPGTLVYLGVIDSIGGCYCQKVFWAKIWMLNEGYQCN